MENQLKNEAYKFSVESIVRFYNNLEDDFAEQPNTITRINANSFEIASYFSEIKNRGTENSFSTFKCLASYSTNDFLNKRNWSIQITEIKGKTVEEILRATKRNCKSIFQYSSSTGHIDKIEVKNGNTNFNYRKVFAIFFLTVFILICGYSFINRTNKNELESAKIETEIISQKTNKEGSKISNEPIANPIPKQRLNYKIIGTMASEGCPNCIDVLVKASTTNQEMVAIVYDLISQKGTKNLMIDFFTSKRDYTQHKDNGPYFANYSSFNDGNKMTYVLILNDDAQIDF